MAGIDEPSVKGYKYKRRLRNFLLQPLWQIRLGLYSIALSVGFALLLSGILWHQFHRFYEMVLELTDLKEEVSTMLGDYLLDMGWWVGLCLLAYVAINITVSVIYTHKLIGPTYAFRRHIQNLSGGEYGSRVLLRKNDAFSEVAEDLNKLAEVLEDSARRKAKEGRAG